MSTLTLSIALQVYSTGQCSTNRKRGPSQSRSPRRIESGALFTVMHKYVVHAVRDPQQNPQVHILWYNRLSLCCAYMKIHLAFLQWGCWQMSQSSSTLGHGQTTLTTQNTCMVDQTNCNMHDNMGSSVHQAFDYSQSPCQTADMHAWFPGFRRLWHSTQWTTCSA